MGKVIEKIIKKELDGKPIIGEFTVSFEYRTYLDESEKVIDRFYQTFTGFLMKDKTKNMTSSTCYLLDKINRKLFCFQLHPNSKIESLNTPVVIESILQNIKYFGDMFVKVYKENIDNVPLFPLSIMSPAAQREALLNWRAACALRYNLDISQCHEVTLSETMDLSSLENNEIPDYQIIQSQRGDISLFKKF